MNLRTFILAILAVAPLPAQTIDLAGKWRFALDPKDNGLTAGPQTWNFADTIQLPGSTASQGKGDPLQIQLNLKKPAMQHLHQKFSYIGPAWYQRTVSIPPDWKGKDIILTLERVLWESRVWIDSKPVGSPQNSLSTPHRYDLTNTLTPGSEHTLTLRIDNRLIVDIGTIGHAYTQETQSIWNGVIGDLKLEALPKSRLNQLAVRTKADGSLRVDADGTFARGQKLVATLDGESIATADAAPGIVPLLGRSKKAKPWSELSPTLHELTVSLVDSSGKTLHRLSRHIGFREFTAEGRDLRINGTPTFLRGNLECAIFPQTGHPDAEGKQWQKIMRTSREYGINHLRFHSWCPPEATFEAADRHGIYLQVELPNWTFEMGGKPKNDEFFKAEGERIFREYGHHPSFVMFSLGNELKGNLKFMDGLIEHFRTLAPELLYTSTSYAFSPRGLRAGPQDDFFITQQSASGWVRGQGFLNSTFPTTDSDYAEGLSSVTVPLVTHEVGQYVVYPNLAELPKYESTPMRPTALEAIRADLTAKGLLDDAPRFTRDSGKLAALLYKEDIERALRTKGLAGIQLLQLQDFPGQSTATVGLLDAFWDSKGAITPKEFRQFSSPVVPLVRMKKFVWENTETLSAAFELANYSEGPLNAGFVAKLVDQHGVAIAEKRFGTKEYPPGNALPVGTYQAPLASFGTATRLDLIIESADGSVRNSWPVWIYPAAQDAPEVITHGAATAACLADLAAGKTVLLLPVASTLRNPIAARFIPVFWSPLHFANQPGTLGATIDTAHPLWKNFPTDTHTHWQWWELTANSAAVDLTNFHPTIAKPFRFIDKFDRNALPAAIFEARVGPGKLLVCTLDVRTDPAGRIVARQLHRALKRYAASPDFAPSGPLTPDQLRSLFRGSGIAATASSSHPDHPPALAIDGDPATLWHSDWRASAARLPITLTLDLQQATPLAGLRLRNRADNPNGRVKHLDIEISIDGTRWRPAGHTELPNHDAPQTVTFPAPVKVRFVRVTAKSTHNGQALAALAEVEPIAAAPGDVRDLGIIPGFND